MKKGKAMVMIFGGRIIDLHQLPERRDAREWMLETIAHSLASINRFNGHTDVPVSVASHSIRVAQYVNRHVQENEDWCRQVLDADLMPISALLHDAHEAFIGDIPTPIYKVLSKQAQKEIDALKERLDEWIFSTLCIPYLLPWCKEYRQLLKEADQRDCDETLRSGFSGRCGRWEDARAADAQEFIKMFEQLYCERQGMGQ